MRLGTVAIVVVVLLAGCAVVYFAWQRGALPGFTRVGGPIGPVNTEPDVTATDSDKSGPTVKPPDSPPPATETVARTTPPNRTTNSAETTNAEESRRPTATADVPEQSPRPSGVPVTGMDRDTLRRTAGEPSVRVLGLEGGRTVETYVYSGTEAGTNTYTRLVDGRVVAVETLPRR